MTQAPGYLATNFGDWAVITGASDGIGKSMAIQLARQGLNLILVSRREPALLQLQTELKTMHPIECEIYPADLSDLMAVERLVQFCTGFDIGLVVAAAGFGTSGPFLESDLSKETELIDLNCSAVAVMAWHFGQRFKARGRGGLVLFSSVLAFNGVPWSTTYAASKAFIQSFGEGLRKEWEPHGLTVLICAPGPTNTGFAKRAKLDLGPTDNAMVVAQHAVNAVGKRSFIRPGYLSKLLGWSLAWSPRSLRILILGTIMEGMVKKYR